MMLPVRNQMNADIKAIIGLGNPGTAYKRTRHNIGFMILDALAERYNAEWQHKDMWDVAQVTINAKNVMLVKPLTYMNNVGKVIPMLTKKGITAAHICVVHDELEKSLGTLQIRLGGSARGHNGLRSIINVIGEDFYRLRFGIGRPVRKEDVSDWVLSNFEIDAQTLDGHINKAVDEIILLISDTQD